MGILLCEQNFRDVWRRNKSVGQKFVKFCAHTHKHTHAAKLVVRIGRAGRKFTCDLTCSASSGSYLRNQPCLKVPHWKCLHMDVGRALKETISSQVGCRHLS